METIDPDLARRVWQRVMNAQCPARQSPAPKGGTPTQPRSAVSAKRAPRQPGHPSRGGHR